MPKIKSLTMGTRGSLLALTQSSQFVEELEAKNGIKVETKVIKTTGDNITNVPLWQLDGKDFFTKELDIALLAKEVDFVVHSLKDLGQDRPRGIELACITKRLFANDILLLKTQTIQDLRTNKISEIVVGTSSPRRITNIERFLPDYLPSKEGKVKKVTTKILRGNVNTRVKKLVDGEYDAILLAMTGLERLARHPKAGQEMAPMLKELGFMILPQSIFPTSPGQGALGIECRSDDAEVKEILSTLHCQLTAKCVKKERDIFRQYGGGCHLPMGIHSSISNDVQSVYKRGLHKELPVSESYTLQEKPPVKFSREQIFVGMPLKKDDNGGVVYDELITKTELTTELNVANPGHIFVSSQYGISLLEETNPHNQFIWAAGARTMKKLAQAGFWVSGTTDSQGEDNFKELLNSSVMELFYPTFGKLNAQILTNNDSQSSVGKVISVYERKIQSPQEEFKTKIAKVETLFWTSFPQYKTFIEAFPALKNKIHCCGVGKTYQQFRQNSVNVMALTGVDEFLKWAQGQIT